MGGVSGVARNDSVPSYLQNRNDIVRSRIAPAFREALQKSAGIKLPADILDKTVKQWTEQQIAEIKGNVTESKIQAIIARIKSEVGLYADRLVHESRLIDPMSNRGRKYSPGNSGNIADFKKPTKDLGVPEGRGVVNVPKELKEAADRDLFEHRADRTRIFDPQRNLREAGQEITRTTEKTKKVVGKAWEETRERVKPIMDKGRKFLGETGSKIGKVINEVVPAIKNTGKLAKVAPGIGNAVTAGGILLSAGAVLISANPAKAAEGKVRETINEYNIFDGESPIVSDAEEKGMLEAYKKQHDRPKATK